MKNLVLASVAVFCVVGVNVALLATFYFAVFALRLTTRTTDLSQKSARFQISSST
jgi:hypothetical protein